MSAEREDALPCQEKLVGKNNYEGKFNTLRIISLKAINEFEALQKKCEENYGKYLSERENYMRTKKELDILKEVSGEALGEYENLHRKYQIEQDCRDKAEEFAKQAVKENKQLKRQSAVLLSTLTSKVVDIDLEELANESQNVNTITTDDHGLCNKQIEGLKEQVESLKIKTDELSQKLTETEEKLYDEESEHRKTKEELKNNKANFKQLNRVSLLALDDYTNLQRKYEMEIQHRAEAEKLADEESDSNEASDQTSTSNTNESNQPTVSRDHEAIMKQTEVISQDVAGEERLKKALDEISTLTKQLHDQKTEFDEKVKELEEELASSNDVQKLKNLEDKINTFAQGMETLETRLSQAQNRAFEAEAKAQNLEELLKKAQETTNIPAPPPLPPPPPPPPPPGQLLKKFVGIIGGGGKKKNPKKDKPEDPRIKAMSEMMERIKHGKVELRKIDIQRNKSGENEEGSAMENLKSVLTKLKRSPSKEDTRESFHETDNKTSPFGVQLRKAAERKPRSLSDVDNGKGELCRITLRKARSQSTGDVLDDEEPAMDKDLLKILTKQKAASEREEKPEKNGEEKTSEVQQKEEDKKSDEQEEQESSTEGQKQELNEETKLES